MVDTFGNDRDYTYEGMVQHLNVIELSMRDGSIRQCKPLNLRIRSELNLVHKHCTDMSAKSCRCSNEKHLPAITQLSIDAISNSETQNQREFMNEVRDKALAYTRRLNEGQMTDEEIYELGTWAEQVNNELKNNPSAYNKCGKNPEELLLTLSGLASEGTGFIKDKVEKRFMANLRDKAEIYRKQLVSKNLTEEEADEIREWSREMRRRVARKEWTGELPKTSRKDDYGDDIVFTPMASRQGDEFGSDLMFTPMEMRQRDESSGDGSGCKTCTTIPERYRNKSTDVRHVKVSRPVSMHFSDEEVQFVEY